MSYICTTHNITYATRSRGCPECFREELEREQSRDLIRLLDRQREWSTETFGPGDRFDGIMAHIRKELVEIEAKPSDVTEWIDVVILAFDGAWRQGHTSEDIVAALNAKYDENREREWPDWRTAPAGEPIEHVRGVR